MGKKSDKRKQARRRQAAAPRRRVGVLCDICQRPGAGRVTRFPGVFSWYCQRHYDQWAKTPSAARHTIG